MLHSHGRGKVARMSQLAHRCSPAHLILETKFHVTGLMRPNFPRSRLLVSPSQAERILG